MTPSLAYLLAPTVDVCDGCGETAPIFERVTETVSARLFDTEVIESAYCWQCADDPPDVSLRDVLKETDDG